MPVDFFLKLTDIEGESTDEKHKNEIVVESFSWGLLNPAEDRVSVQDFLFTSLVDKSSPILMLSCATGKHIDEAVLTARKAGEKPLEYLIIKLKEVLVTGFQPSGSAGDVLPVQSFSLNFGEITFDYTLQREDGSKGETISRGFNVKDVKGT
jgi:type VI secretion system secreted protein Hcp